MGLLAKLGLKRHHRNTAIYLGASLLSKGASLLLIPIYTSRLSREEYASYGLCQTLYWVVPPLLTLSLSAALSRFYFDHVDPEKRDRTVGVLAGAILVLALVPALLVGLLTAAVPSLHLLSLDVHALRPVLLTCSAIAIAEIATTYLRASERAARFALLNIGVFACTAGTSVYLVMVRQLGLQGVLWGMFSGQAVGALYAIGFVLKRFRLRFDWKMIRHALDYSMPFIPHMVGTSLMVGVDRWALEFYGQREGLGLYTLAVQLTVPITLAMTAWNEASSPRLFAAWRDEGYLGARKALPRITLGFILCGGGALLAVLCGVPFLRLFVGERFQAAFPLIPFVGLTLLVGALFSAFINVLFLEKRTRLIPVLTLISLGVNVLLNVLLVPRYGVHGAILAIGLAFAFRSGVMLVAALRALRRMASQAAPAAPPVEDALSAH